MNLFLIGWHAGGRPRPADPETYVRDLLPQLPEPRPSRLERWQAPSGRLVMVCAAHDPDGMGGVRYVHTERERLALFSGRPIAWTSDAAADGRAPLDPSFYLAPAAEWRDRLDGRYVAVRYDDRDASLEVCPDALGAYPVFAANVGGTRWISNSAELLRSIVGTRDLEPAAVASLLGTGWSLGPTWAGIERLPVALTAPEMGAGFDADQAARTLVAATTALADWPGRTTLLQLSGGRDSRLLLATGVVARAITTGSPDSPDVQLARELCEAAGVEHALLRAHPPVDLAGSARLLSLTGGGAISLNNAVGYFTPTGDGMPLLLNGQGGEIARSFYGHGDGLDRDGLVHRLFDLAATSGGLLTAYGRELVEQSIGGIVDAALEAGVAPGDVPDVFHLAGRMAGWAAVGHGCVEYAKGDVVCPLWSRRLLAQQLGLPSEMRTDERFPLATLEALSPALARIPYAPLQRPRPRVDDGFGEVHQRVRDALAAQPGCPIWDVLDRERAEAVLSADSAELDPRRRDPVWRLATAFMVLPAR